MDTTRDELVPELLLEAIRMCTNGLSDDEIYEVCSSGGEGELNDLLRHAANRIVRSQGWIVQREQTRPGLFKRVDITVSDRKSLEPMTVIEAKMFYASDLLDIPRQVDAKLEADAAKLEPIVDAGRAEGYLLVWVPYYSQVRRDIRHLGGHIAGSDGWSTRYSLESTEKAAAELLGGYGGPIRSSRIRSTDSEDGSLVLDAYLVPLR
ncbi:hypothetical protein K0651_10215 [Ornithinimicrobium sp. Arc0846-15]|nr:hypothetical protein [Ornithinimicrobium laminariae]